MLRDAEFSCIEHFHLESARNPSRRAGCLLYQKWISFLFFQKQVEEAGG